MFGKYANFEFEGQQIKVFVFCTPNITDKELYKRGLKLILRGIKQRKG